MSLQEGKNSMNGSTSECKTIFFRKHMFLAAVREQAVFERDKNPTHRQDSKKTPPTYVRNLE
jgi:hypothetical protein